MLIRTVVPALVAGLLCLPRIVGAGPHDSARFALHATEKFIPSKTYPTVCSAAPLEVGLECMSFKRLELLLVSPGGLPHHLGTGQEPVFLKPERGPPMIRPLLFTLVLTLVGGEAGGP